MREIRTSGSEGGGAGINRLFLPLSYLNSQIIAIAHKRR